MLHNRGRLASFQKEEEPDNPMDGLSNLADVMLVFACGLLLALIINWNIDISNVKEMEMEYTGDDKQVNAEEIEGEGMTELGKVYQDPETGKTYIVKE